MVTVQPVHWLEATAHKEQPSIDLTVAKAVIPRVEILVYKLVRLTAVQDTT